MKSYFEQGNNKSGLASSIYTFSSLGLLLDFQLVFGKNLESYIVKLQMIEIHP
jgi:hypothetical protein